MRHTPTSVAVVLSAVMSWLNTQSLRGESNLSSVACFGSSRSDNDRIMKAVIERGVQAMGHGRGGG